MRRRDRRARTRSERAFLYLAGVAIAVAAFALGRLSATPDGSLASRSGEPDTTLVRNAGPAAISAPRMPPGVELVQNSEPAPDPRELMPLPTPGQPGEAVPPGELPEGEANCPLYFFQDGQFFELQPGQPGGPGPFGQGTPELFPLDPVPGAPEPGQPPQREPRPPEPPSPFFRAPGVAQAPLPAPQLASTPPVELAGHQFELNASSSH